MKQKGFAPILIVILIAAIIGGYLVYSGKVNLNKPQDKTTSLEQNNNYRAELQGYPIYPKAKFIRKETKTPSDYDYCKNIDRIECANNTTNYIFSIDEPYNYENMSNNNFYKWYNDKNNLLGWKRNGGAEGISGYDKGDDSFYLLYTVEDSGKIEITIRIPTSKNTQSASDETANWKTYTSTKANYLLKYPSEWPLKVSADLLPSNVEVIYFNNNDKVKSADYTFAVIEVMKQSVDDYIKNNNLIVDIKNTTIDGKKAISYKRSGGIPQLPIIEYAVSNNNLTYIIRLVGSIETNKNKDKNKKIFNQILSTFKFTNSENFATGLPEAAANGFYQWYLSCLNDHFQKAANGEGSNKTPSEDCPYQSNQYISQKLVDNFNKFEEDFSKRCKGSECTHGDLILCAQNTPGSISVDKAEVSGNIANTIVHTFYSGSGDNPVKVTLEQEDKNWKITNLTCNNR